MPIEKFAVEQRRATATMKTRPHKVAIIPENNEGMVCAPNHAFGFYSSFGL